MYYVIIIIPGRDAGGVGGVVGGQRLGGHKSSRLLDPIGSLYIENARINSSFTFTQKCT